MAKSERNKLVIPYLISILLVAVSINSIARGIEDHEVWRIIVAAIGGSFFLFLAILMAIRLIKLKGVKKKRRRTSIFSRK